MTARATFTEAEIKRAAKVALDLGCELVIEQSEPARMVVRPIDERKEENAGLGPKAWD